MRRRSRIPGPMTPEGHARAIANLQPTANLSHGVDRWLKSTIAPPCERCVARQGCPRAGEALDGTCIIATQRQQELIDALMSLPHIEEMDLALVREFAKLTVALEIADVWLARVGPWSMDGEDTRVQHLVSTRLTISRQVKELARELGLTPASRARLRSEEMPMAERIARVFVESLDTDAKDGDAE